MKRTLTLTLMVALAGGVAGCASTDTKVCTTTSATQRIDNDTSIIYTRECGVLRVSDNVQQDGRIMGGARYRVEVRNGNVVKIIDRLGRAAD